MTRTTSFLAGIVLVGFCGALAIADPIHPETPDDALSPGAVASTSQKEICAFMGAMTYSQAHRATPVELKDWIFREYGMEPPGWRERRDWEIDHRVPLCLGGADEAANLWPQHRESYPKKDDLEAYACRMVCRGAVPLAEAQAWFLGDWRVAYHRELAP